MGVVGQGDCSFEENAAAYNACKETYSIQALIFKRVLRFHQRRGNCTFVVDHDCCVEKPEGQQSWSYGRGCPRQQTPRGEQVVFVPAIEGGLCLGGGAVEGHDEGGGIASAKFCEKIGTGIGLRFDSNIPCIFSHMLALLAT